MLLVVLCHVIFKISKKIATELNKIFLEVVVANGFEKEAIKILKRKKNLRIIDASNFSFKEILKVKSIDDSMLIQSDDLHLLNKKKFKSGFKKKT